jgi:hypothetical protein
LKHSAATGFPVAALLSADAPAATAIQTQDEDKKAMEVRSKL